jgi:hypothetical protein
MEYCFYFNTYSFIICTLHLDQIEDNGVGGTRSTHERDEK